MKNVHKTYISSDAELTKELADLRKGVGLTPVKLTDKPTIRALFSRLTNLPIPSLTNSQIHAFLITEMAKIITRNGQALYNAFGLIEGSKNTLSDRRADFAKQLSKHPDTIERYENHGLAELTTHL